MSKQEYQEYLRSPHWKRVKARFFSLNMHECFVCDSSKEPIQLHHRTYARLHGERMEDLVALCERCHTVLHSQANWHGDSHVVLRQRYMRGGETRFQEFAARQGSKQAKRRRSRPKSKAEKSMKSYVTVRGYYACPACHALPGEKCRTPSGGKRRKLHRERYLYASGSEA